MDRVKANNTSSRQDRVVPGQEKSRLGNGGMSEFTMMMML